MMRLAIIGIVILVITTSIGGFFLYQKSIVNALQEKVNQQAAEITVLKEDKIKLETSNKTLESEISRKATETKEVYAELSALREADATSKTRLKEIEAKLNDKERLDRITAVRLSRKASLLLRIMDRNVKCYIENFSRIDGKCVAGRFILIPNKVEGNP